MTENPPDNVLDLLDTFVTDAINICDEPHGALSNEDKVKGMRQAFVVMKCVIAACKTPEGMAELQRDMESEHKHGLNIKYI